VCLSVLTLVLLVQEVVTVGQYCQTLGPAHTTPRGVGLMAWAIRRSVFSSHA
jgi:hypothetical protein